MLPEYKNYYYIKYAYELAVKSPDPSTQNASLLISDDGEIISEGINEFPRDVKYKPERWERPLKYKIIEHAERNSIYKAAKLGRSTEGLTMFCPWAACSDCARAIIQAGIKKLVTHKQALDKSPSFWGEEIKVAFTMLKEASVEVFLYDGFIGTKEQVLHSGKLWTP
jgi:dCMP deaminase